MAGTHATLRHVIGSSTACIELPSRTTGTTTISSRAGAPFSVRISTRSTATCGGGGGGERQVVAEGPSCIFVGPLETASKETLEALYLQARDAYYSGEPLIVDDMFDRVELKLRWYGSKSVVKYPRCSIRRQSTYADAEEDISQALALASIWIVFLAIGGVACAGPILYAVGLAYQNAFGSGISSGSSQASLIEFLATLNGILFMAVGSLIGYPIVSASVKVLQGIWRNDLVALRGACPNCGEEVNAIYRDCFVHILKHFEAVFAFVKSDQSSSSPHRADCHVCDSLLEFRTKVEKTTSTLGRRWVYGRIYLISRRRQRWK